MIKATIYAHGAVISVNRDAVGIAFFMYSYGPNTLIIFE